MYDGPMGIFEDFENCDSTAATPLLDAALAHEIACIGAEEQFDRLEAGDYPGAWREGLDEEDEPVEQVAEQDDDDFFPDFPDEEDLPYGRQISGVTLNGGPVFEDDDELSTNSR